MTDVLSDTLAELLREGLDATGVTRAIARVRQRWGGSQTYIRATDRETLDKEIKADLESGRPDKEIAQRARVSVATVRRRKSTWFDS